MSRLLRASGRSIVTRTMWPSRRSTWIGTTWASEPLVADRERDRLGLEEPLDALGAALAPQARRFVPAEGRVRHHRVAVDAEGARPHGAGHADRALHVVGLHGGAEPVVGVVGEADRLLLVGEGDHPEH